MPRCTYRGHGVTLWFSSSQSFLLVFLEWKSGPQACLTSAFTCRYCISPNYYFSLRQFHVFSVGLKLACDDEYDPVIRLRLLPNARIISLHHHARFSGFLLETSIHCADMYPRLIWSTCNLSCLLSARIIGVCYCAVQMF